MNLVRAALKGFVFVLILAGFLNLPASAWAKDKHKKLTEANITEFINTTSAISSGAQGSMSRGKIIKYLERHLDKRAFFKTTMRYTIPGFPPQETALKFNKKEFIENVKKGAQALGDYEITTEIGKIRISKKGRSATVQTTGHESGMMPIALEGTAETLVPVDGVSQCLQTIRLTKKGIIQMYSANCTTTIRFSGF